MDKVSEFPRTLVYSSPAQRLEVYQVQHLSGTLICVRQQHFHEAEDCQREQQRFLLQQRLSHQNICQVHRVSSETEAGEWVLSVELEWCGRDLDSLTRSQYRQGLQQESCGQLLEQLVSALAHAQENGVCHRDIKPSNLFLTEAGLYKVGDFGCAKVFDSSALGHTMAGTPLYLSPILRKAFTQQLLGQEVGQVDHNPYKSDVYSLGLTLVYLLKPSAVNILGNQVELISTISNLPIHPNFQGILRLMLEPEETSRPDFLELAAYFQPSQASAPPEEVQSSVPLAPDPPIAKRRVRIVKKAAVEQPVATTEERFCVSCLNSFVLQPVEPWRLDLIGSKDSESAKNYCSLICFRNRDPQRPVPSVRSEPDEEEELTRPLRILYAVPCYEQYLHCFVHTSELPPLHIVAREMPTLLFPCEQCDMGVWTRESLPNIEEEVVRNSLYASLVFVVMRKDGEELFRAISAKAMPAFQAGVCHFCTVTVEPGSWLGFVHNNAIALVCSRDCIVGAQENANCPSCGVQMPKMRLPFPQSGHKVYCLTEESQCMLCFCENGSYALKCGHSFCDSCLSCIPRRDTSDFSCLYCGKILRKDDHEELFK